MPITRATTAQEALRLVDEADDKYGKQFQEYGTAPTREQIDILKTMNEEVKEYQKQALDFQEGDDLRKEQEARRKARNIPVDNIGHGTPGDLADRKQKAAESLGDAFLGDAQFKSWLSQVAPNGRVADRQSLISPSIPIPANVKGLITGLSDTSGGPFVQTQYLPTVQLPMRPLTLKDLISVIPVNSDAVSYARITGMTNAAAPVLEATTAAGAVGTKPESDLATELVTETIKTIAHWFPVTNRALADAPQLRALINQFGFYGLEEELEDQIASGSGVGENLTGISVVSGVSTQAYATDLLTTTRKAVTKARTVHARPNGWLFSLADWEAIDLLADNNKVYYYGGPQVLGSPRLWGYPVVDSEALADGFSYLADFKTVMLFDREQASMQMSNSHQDFFIKNLVAMLFEMRVGLGYQRPASIVKVDLTA